MIKLERNAEEYLQRILARLPADHAAIVQQRFGDITDTFRGSHIDELQGADSITLSQCKGLLSSVAQQMPPNIKDEVMKAAEM